MEMYVAWAIDGNGKWYKFIRSICKDSTFAEQIVTFIDDVYECLDNNCRIDILTKQDDIKFEGTTVEYEWRKQNNG